MPFTVITVATGAPGSAMLSELASAKVTLLPLTTTLAAGNRRMSTAVPLGTDAEKLRELPATGVGPKGSTTPAVGVTVKVWPVEGGRVSARIWPAAWSTAA